MTTAFFDLDGTLVDPLQAIGKSVCHALEKMGRPVPSLESLGWLIGPPLQGSLARLLGTDDPDECARCLGFYRERFSTTGLVENTVYEGVPGMLAELRAAGVRMWVATSKPRVYAAPILGHTGLSEFFEGVYGSELDGTRTNNGDLIGHLLQEEQLEPQDCVMVGDREHDIRGAAINNVRGLGASWGYGTADELRAAGAVTLCESPADVLYSLVGA